jgi:hypothetical protein
VDPGPHPDHDPHHFGNLDPHPDPHQHQIKIRIRINLQMTSQTVWNMNLFEHIFNGFLSLYFEAGIWIRIRIRVKSWIRIRTQIKTRIRIRFK